MQQPALKIKLRNMGHKEHYRIIIQAQNMPKSVFVFFWPALLKSQNYFSSSSLFLL